MTNEEIQSAVDAQREYYKSGATLSADFRISCLKKLYKAVKEREDEIAEALRLDLGKSKYESFMCETGLVLSEIGYMIKHTRKFSRKARVRTPISQFPARSVRCPMPYGTVLIMSPWNYPVLLTLEPLADAIAAGNTAVIKTSAYSPNSASIVQRIISDCFPSEYVTVITGGRRENAALLDVHFDMVFFTGSGAVGREVLHKCADRLTPAVLELGGKSPCIVDESADISLAARRIVFGKLLNCGQTCVAPDYVLCHRSVKKQFISAVAEEIKRQYGDEPLKNPEYGKIINEKHFARLLSLIDAEKVVLGGESDAASCRIAPTVMDGVTYSDAVMGEEIFGPLLPVLEFDDFDREVDRLKTAQKPLALYFFSNDRRRIARVTDELLYGGGCINDVVIHLATAHMGFGGVGESGMGSYHGRDGFDAFTHYKSVVYKSTRIDLPVRYQPYKNKFYEKLLRLFLK